MADENTNTFEAVLPDPTFSRSLQSSFESNVIGSAFLMGSDAISAMGNKTPVNDAEIEDRISREKLDTYIGQFTSIRTQGELDAKVDRIRRQEFNKRVGEAGGGQALVTDLIAGVLDAPTFIPFAAGFKTGMTVKQAAPRFAVAAATDAVVTEGALHATLSETHTMGDSAVNIAGSVVLGSLIGAGAAKLLRKADADKMGAGIARETDDALTGKLDADAADLQARVLRGAEDIRAGRPIETHTRLYRGEMPVDTDGLPPVADGFVRMYHGAGKGGNAPDTGGGRWTSPEFVYARDYRGPDSDVYYVDVPKTSPHLREAYDVSGTNMKPAFASVELPEELAKTMRKVPPRDGLGHHYTRSVDRAKGFAGPDGTVYGIDVPIARMGELKPSRSDGNYIVPEDIRAGRFAHSDSMVGPMPQKELVAKLTEILGEEPTPTQIAFANTLGMEQLARYGSKLFFFGKSIPLEMMAATGQAPRRFANQFFMLRGNLKDGVTADTSIMGAKGVINGLQGQAKDGIVGAWREWSREMAGSRVGAAYARMTSDEASLETFSDLVFRATAYGDVNNVTDPALREALSNPAVQKAAKAYRKFDDELFSREVEAGLIGNSAKSQDHVRHLYAQVPLLAGRDRFIQTETGHAFEAEMGKATRKAAETREKDVKSAVEFEVRERERIDRVHERSLVKAEKNANTQAEKWLKATVLARTRELKRTETARFNEIDAKSDAAIDVAREMADRAAERKFRLNPTDKIGPTSVDHVIGKDSRAYSDGVFEKMRERIAQDHVDARQAVTNDLDARYDLSLEKFNSEFITLRKRLESEGIARANADRHAGRVNVTKTRVQDIELAEKMYARATGTEAQNEMMKWAKSHADGVHTAAAHGRRSIIDQAPPGNLATGGNVRGGRISRNVYTPTRVLMEEGWLDTDLLKVIDRQTREDGMDVVIANKFRRQMTDTEREALTRGSEEAYWRDGKDPSTVPDLDLKMVRNDIVREYELLEKSAVTPGGLPDVPRRAALAKEREAMITYMEESVSGARGLESEGSITAMLTPGSVLARGVNFSLYMGGSLVTNTIDAGRIAAYHGLGNATQYFAMRMGEKFRSGVWSDVAKAENREMAQAAGFALNHVNFGKTSMAMGIMDPYAMSTRESGAANLSAWLGRVGGQAFGLNWWNNKTQEIGYAMSQFRLSKLAVSGDISALPRRDQEWLRYIGVDQAKLTSFQDAMSAQGITSVDGTNFSKINHTKFDRVTQDAFVSAMQKDVTTMIVNPDYASLPRMFRNPVMAAVLQFQSYAMEAAQAVTMRDGGRLREGDSAAVIQGMFTLMAGSLLAYYMTGVARSAVDKVTGRNEGKTEIDKRVRAWSETPAQLFYQTFDYSGLLPMVTNVNNLFEGFTGVGFKELAREVDGGKRIGSTSTRNMPIQGDSRVMNVLGPTARTLKEASGLVGDTISGQFSQQTATHALKLTPFASAFYLRNALEGGVDAMGAAMELKKRSNRSRPFQQWVNE